MKKLSIMAGMVLALAMGIAVMPVKAQDETPGQQVTINASIPVGGHNCGRARSYGFSCNVSIDGGGSAYISVNTYYSNGFILFGNVLDLGQSMVTSVSNVMYDSRYRVTSLTVSYIGNTNDGDGDTYTVTATYTFTYQPCPPSTKYCSILGLTYMTSGQQTVTYN